MHYCAFNYIALSEAVTIDTFCCCILILEEVFLAFFLLFGPSIPVNPFLETWFMFPLELHFQQIHFLVSVFYRLFRTAYFFQGNPFNSLVTGSSYATNWC